ncbi:bifunctional UDP-N-acetylglucosamine diphosphorylase/glucosamine-1-phosphate N-acetyltransferase GlmU [Candidatus Nucleicultrix amoebiphila]|jgi:bifunctional UDP-N-acetylglucosamine pyrophosphorylase/glucosamine-1-phosphate N-acetyltransferase|uniref:Bifunctional protein GlmU n=1 Tax=Candidatus Nucleicultrix amoebiphila FS5 TaxID=1414854 RepID=A0A1W6N6D4_9PROT|nr:bifunctional UDP-N-acetylglucosamine diphosphorylase/glucosamine-1-phosphate N-acetyltransferase GlmU [Candidatus Nucleicultrix amoebiphila]ARN85450.1 hypothetical protein GQ61_09295 [Candidatus Nucleicultrix amoebiphila FS5]
MKSSPSIAIILAAGQGSRMKSSLPKVLHPLAGKPIIQHIVDTVNQTQVDQTIVVLSPQMKEVEAYLRRENPKIEIVYQDPPKGTAHAVLSARPYLENLPGKVLILFGDTPFIQSATLQKTLESLDQSQIVVLAMTPKDKRQYARTIIGDDGFVEKIIEYKDASETEKATFICNSGFMGIKGSCALSLLEKIPPINNEYYLFEAVRLGNEKNIKTRFMMIEEWEAQGINSQQELAFAENFYQTQQRIKFMDSGVTFQAPETVFLSHDTILEPGVTLEPFVYFGPNVHVKRDARIKGFSHIEGALIEEKAVIGPYARIRPNTVVGQGVRIGNFVEAKNTVFEEGSKANHLSYIGDAHVGKKTNIGAGTITCNYDGLNKYKTVIEENVFIGSNTALIAPITIGKGSIIGAGSTLSQSVSADAIALTRSDQREIKEAAARFRKKRMIKESS